jgi:hypothetical protein
MAKRDYYEVPNISRSCSEGERKASFREHRNRGVHLAVAVVTSLCASNLVLEPSAVAQTGSGMQQLHGKLLLAEKDLGVAIRKRDFSRAKSVNESLSNQYSEARKLKLAAHPCLDALETLTGAAVTAELDLHPVVTGDLGSMNAEELRGALKPSPGALQDMFGKSSSAYRKHMADCEREIGSTQTSRSLPDRLHRK